MRFKAVRGRSRALCQLFGLMLALGMFGAPSAQAQVPDKLDLNRASLEQILALPIPEDVARAIEHHRTYVDWFRSFYDLSKIEGVTPEILARLRPLVSTMPPPEDDEAMQRLENSFRQIQSFLNQEGTSEGLAEEYMDQLRNPNNVNRQTVHELQGFQNVSPVDAAAVVRARESAGRITSDRQLRSSDGLTYWGYRNMRDFVTYEDPPSDHKLHGDVQLLSYNTPYLVDPEEILTEYVPYRTLQNPADPNEVFPRDDFSNARGWGIRHLDSAEPALLTKVRLRYGTSWKGGIMTWRQVGEREMTGTLKGFLSWDNPNADRHQIDRVVVGNFRVAFGQGLVMDNTDFFLARKTGYGWNKRPMTLLGDLSRSYEYALRGMAVEGHTGRFRGIGFWSQQKKDGVLNPDGTINRYISMAPRFDNDELERMLTLNEIEPPQAATDSIEEPFGLRRDAFLETLYGGQAQFEFWPGTHIGVTGYEARYGKRFDPRPQTLFHSLPSTRTPNGALDLLEARDAEIWQGYNSRNIGEFRRIYGANFQAVYENFALQGEYGKLDTSTEGLGLLSAGPEAMILNAWVQYSDLNFLGIWRDYDVGYDNPYSRGFSQDSRYEQTLLGDPFRLQNPLYAFIDTYNPQPKAERGFFFSMRYRVSRNFTITGFEFDQWTRQADGQDQRRYTFRAEYAPIFPLRFRLRQRFSSRGELYINDVRRFRGWDTRLETRVRLSGRDELRFLYSLTATEFAARPRLSGAAEVGQDTPLSQAASPSNAIQGVLHHFVSDRTEFVFSTEMYEGFLWNFEDNEFILLDDIGFRNWFLVRTRLSNTLAMGFKMTHDNLKTVTNVDIRQFNDPVGQDIDGDNVRKQRTSFRLQLDYTF